MSYPERFIAAFAAILMTLVIYNTGTAIAIVVFTCMLGAAFFGALVAIGSYLIWPERPRD